MFRSYPRMRRLAPVAVTAVALLPFSALADEPAPGSSQGGSPAASAPAGYKVSTQLPKKISVDKKTGNTSLTATVRNGEAKEIGAIKLKVVGFEGLRITAVEGCTAIPTGQLPPGSNSGYTCAVDKLAAGQSRTYRVSAAFDLRKAGQVCLPVTLGDTKTLLWQQGPVHFGTTDTSSDAPDTPLLLGTKNVPSGSAATPGGATPSSGGGTASPSGSPSTAPTAAPSRTTGGAAPTTGPGRTGGPATTAPSPTKSAGKPAATATDDYDEDELARTGASPTLLILAALVAALLLAAGATGLWLTRRRSGGRH
ncbi:hypothetical protein [Streptomyces sp. NPDC053048]|uniref:hypothetical protein n=1 Tax=Streptomyces sp. NPDC053048 TaxID=3365694 RepID=UPI0037D7BE4B